MNPLDRIKALRHEGDLQGARRLGEDLLASGEADDSAVISILIDTYLDIQEECRRAGITAYIQEIDRRLDALTAECHASDRQAARRRALAVSSLPGYGDIHAFDELSLRDGSEEEAYRQVRAYLTENAVDPRLHEMVALIFYRYLRACYTSLESAAVRRVLADYLSLALPKPSRVHSLMLRMAVRASRRFPDFNFARFFRLWDPRTLRPDDIEATGADGRPLLSLAVASLIRVVDSPQAAELSPILELIPASREQKAAILRDTFYHLTRKALEADDQAAAVELLNLYAGNCAMHTASRRHSSMLGMALRAMTADREWSFPEFFIDWDPSYFRANDFLPSTLPDGTPLPSLASRAMSRAFHAVKNDIPRFAYLLPGLIRAFDTIAEAMPGGADEIMERRRALMLSWADCDDSAIDRMCALARRSDERSARFWLDFAEILRPRVLKMGAVALGLIRSNPSDPDLRTLRLTLAQLLHFDGRDDSAALELRLYTDAVHSVAAEPSARYGAIAATIDPEAIAAASNELLYHTLAAEALDVIYSNIPSQTMTVVEAGDSSLTLSSGGSGPISLDTRTWQIAARLRPGGTVEMKFDSAGQIVTVRPVDRPDYDALPLHYGIIVATEPLTIHCAGKSEAITASGGSSPLKVGQTVTFRVYRDNSATRRAIDILPVDIVRARRHFDHISIVIYDREPDGTARYSAGPERESGSLSASFAAGLETSVPHELYYYRTPDGQRNPVSISEAIDPAGCPAIKSVSGQLTVTSDCRYSVRDVSIPDKLIGTRIFEAGTYVAATAVYIPRTGSSAPYWQALSLDSY